MISAWSEYLLTKGACLEHEVVAHFGDAASELESTRGGLVLADLSDWGLIALAGEEAQTFLHNLVTNDLRDLSQANAVFAALCSAKGRMLANFLVLKRGDELLLMLPADLREAIQKRLSMFILRAKVKARDASDEWVRLGLAGPGAEVLLAETLGLQVGASPMSVGQNDTALALRLGTERFDLLVQPAAAPALWDKLAAKARPVGSPAWAWLLTSGGIPVIQAATQDQFVPQMANMEILHGVSFQKGCYPGQEIVARTQYLGKLKRRMYLAHVDAEAKAGDEVYSPVLPDQTAGMVANAAPAPGGGTDLLVVLRIDSYEDGHVHLGGPAGPQLSFMPLPYSL
ncbi:MAG: folate-binding protein [Gammaproteobacteria bacterium]|nr:MAG: folate-binding protein [Gammaproteobacteria bacterium]